MIRLDNIAPIPRENPVGKAVVRFMRMVEIGVATDGRFDETPKALQPVPLAPPAVRPDTAATTLPADQNPHQ